VHRVLERPGLVLLKTCINRLLEVDTDSPLGDIYPTLAIIDLITCSN
jgi:hypothetical protein